MSRGGRPGTARPHPRATCGAVLVALGPRGWQVRLGGRSHQRDSPGRGSAATSVPSSSLGRTRGHRHPEQRKVEQWGVGGSVGSWSGAGSPGQLQVRPEVLPEGEGRGGRLMAVAAAGQVLSGRAGVPKRGRAASLGRKSTPPARSTAPCGGLRPAGPGGVKPGTGRSPARVSASQLSPGKSLNSEAVFQVLSLFSQCQRDPVVSHNLSRV